MCDTRQSSDMTSHLQSIPSTASKKAGSDDFQPFLNSAGTDFLKNRGIWRIYKVEDTKYETQNERYKTHPHTVPDNIPETSVLR